MNYLHQKKVACIGIGGGGVFYVAKFFLTLGIPVYGFDIKESDNTKELEKLGAKITFSNPTEALEKGTTLFVYSPGLPNNLLHELEELNRDIEHQDVGVFTTELIHKYENNLLSQVETNAFVKSTVAPLYTLDQTKMAYIAVTGTDGKTSTCTMMYHQLLQLGFKPGLISTVTAKIGEKDIDTGFHTTTPSAQDLYKLLKLMEKEGCTHAIVEATSHGLAMGRLAGLKFHAIAYTNITSEHLDYHKTWENYYLAKESLITEHSLPTTFVVLNIDDAKSFTRLQKTATNKGLQTLTYSTQAQSVDFFGSSITEDPTISFEIDSKRIHIPIIGSYNVSNALAATAVISTLTKRKTNEVAPLLEDFQTVTGRMQVLQTKPYTVIVDFAHTANALEQALLTMQKLLPKGKKLIAVFGCTGKRDPSKRFPMGEVSGRLADITILTAEDSRTEKLSDINDEVEKGWQSSHKPNAHLIRFDDDTTLTEVRRGAIEMALNLAEEGDIIIIAGKAHEQSLCFGTIEYPWSDIEETKKLLNQPNNA